MVSLQPLAVVTIKEIVCVPAVVKISTGFCPDAVGGEEPGNVQVQFVIGSFGVEVELLSIGIAAPSHAGVTLNAATGGILFEMTVTIAVSLHPFASLTTTE